jgi:hypothetical protein
MNRAQSAEFRRRRLRPVPGGSGVRIRGRPRDDQVSFALTKEEKQLLGEVAAYGDLDLDLASWARDTLISRALSLRAQRHLLR